MNSISPEILAMLERLIRENERSRIALATRNARTVALERAARKIGFDPKTAKVPVEVYLTHTLAGISEASERLRPLVDAEPEDDTPYLVIMAAVNMLERGADLLSEGDEE
jgi:hypothetical protein